MQYQFFKLLADAMLRVGLVVDSSRGKAAASAAAYFAYGAGPRLNIDNQMKKNVPRYERHDTREGVGCDGSSGLLEQPGQYHFLSLIPQQWPVVLVHVWCRGVPHAPES